MGRRGPLPKPTAQRKLEGNPRRRPLPTNEPTPAKARELPPPPDFLPLLAKQVWTIIGQPLFDADLLTLADYHALEQYVVAYASWRQMLFEIEAVGYVAEFVNDDGSPKYSAPTTQVSLSLKFSAECNRWAKVLGLGPAYRVGLTTNASGQPDEIQDPFAARIANG